MEGKCKQTILVNMGPIMCHKEQNNTTTPNEWRIIPILVNSEFPWLFKSLQFISGKVTLDLQLNFGRIAIFDQVKQLLADVMVWCNDSNFDRFLMHNFEEKLICLFIRWHIQNCRRIGAFYPKNVETVLGTLINTKTGIKSINIQRDIENINTTIPACRQSIEPI